jgi:hypothetical protein
MELSLVTFSTPNFNYSKNLLIRSAKKIGISSIYAYTKKKFEKTSFFAANYNIASQTRGAGFWIWKPYYILHHLEKAKEGDVIFYCDAGVSILKDIDPLVNICLSHEKNKGVLLFRNYQGATYIGRGFEKTEEVLYNQALKNKYWGKRDVFVLMGLDEEKYWNSPQLEGCFLFLKKTAFSIMFVTEWLKYCCDENIVTDKPNTLGKPNFDKFIMHIHDQVVLSLLAAKYDLELFRSPSQYGNHKKLEKYRKPGEFVMLPYTSPETNSDYDTLFLHHRIKKMSFYKQNIFDLKVFIKKQLNKIGIDC